MSKPNEPISFTARMAEIYRQGKNVTEFSKELKALTPADKAWFHTRLNIEGYPTNVPAATTSPS